MEVLGSTPVSPQSRSSSETVNLLTGTSAPENEDGAIGVVLSGLRETIPVVEMKNKGGRPRKYDDVGGSSGGGGGARAGTVLLSPMPLSGFSLSSSPPPSVTRGRGRPRGSGKLQRLAALGGLAAATAGGSFTPHVIAVQIGEDVICKIVAFSEIRSSRALCILSATGTVSAATLSQSSLSVFSRYEGPFEILSLKGSQVFGSTSGSRQHKIGKLTVLLSKPNGEVFGGAVGSLIAACPIQLILGTFKQNISSQLRRISVEAAMAASAVNSPNLGRVPVQKAPADDDDLTSSFLVSTAGEEDNPVAASQHMSHTSLLDVGDENDFLEMPDEKPSLDIKSGYAHFRRFGEG